MGVALDKLTTDSMDAAVRIEAHDRKGPESQGQGDALSGPPRMQRLARASSGEQGGLLTPQPWTPRGTLPRTHGGREGRARRDIGAGAGFDQPVSWWALSHSAPSWTTGRI